MSFLKIVLLGIGVKSFVTAWTPPNPAAQKIARDSFFERRGRSVAKVLKVSCDSKPTIAIHKPTIDNLPSDHMHRYHCDGPTFRIVQFTD